jgi:hypothetical protein
MYDVLYMVSAEQCKSTKNDTGEIP